MPLLLLLPALNAPPESFGAVRLGLGMPALLNASASLYAFHPFEAELGVEGSLGYNGATARAGVSWPLVEREDPRGLSLRAPTLVGYRLLRMSNGVAHAATLNAGLTADLWAAQHIGVEVQLLAGAMLRLQETGSGYGERLVQPDVRLALGVCF